MVKIGSHVSVKGDKMFLGAVEEALSYHANALMVYTGAPQNTIRKSMGLMRIEDALLLMKEQNMDTQNIVVHAPYIINLANPDSEKRKFAVSFLTEEVKRSAKMQATQIVLHPGSAVGGNLDEAILWIAQGINQVIKNTPNLSVKIALETMAGKGREVGRSFEEIKRIIDLVEDQSRIGVCFDTCHVHDAGYPIKDDVHAVFAQFDEIVGNHYISVIHVNDSKNEMGSHKDRHENIGFGHIGFQALLAVCYLEQFKDIPKILETPYIDDVPPYFHEINMIITKTFNPNLKEDVVKK